MHTCTLQRKLCDVDGRLGEQFIHKQFHKLLAKCSRPNLYGRAMATWLARLLTSLTHNNECNIPTVAITVQFREVNIY